MPQLARLAQSKPALAALALALAALLAMAALGAFPRQPGIDFYQFWGVPHARAAARIAQAPYVDPPAYAAVLNAEADASSSASLRGANAARRALEPMGTPFLYAVFSLAGADYDHAHAIFAILQYAAALAAVYALARLRGLAAFPALCAALAVLLTFNPFVQDVRVGNVNSFQLALLAALLAIASRGLYSGRAWVDGLFVGSLALMVAFKPNTPWIAAALALHFWASRGTRAFAIGVAEAVALGIAAFAVGAAYFGGPGAWLEWIGFARGMDGSGLALGLAQGNVSLAMAIAKAHGQPFTSSVGWGLLLGAAFVTVLVVRMGGIARARAALADPWLAASAGILATFASSPLVWPHYHVLLLVPMAWLARTGDGCRVCTWGAIACYALLSRPVIDLLLALELYGALQAAALISWIALLPGLMAEAARRARQEPGAGPGGPGGAPSVSRT